MIDDYIHKPPPPMFDGSGHIGLNVEARALIGRELRRLYSEHEAEPVDMAGLARLLELLADKMGRNERD